MTKNEFEKYEEIGELFKKVNNIVVRLVTKASHFGKIKYSNPLSDVLKKINQIRSDMEERMFKEYPHEAHTHVFYGEKKVVEK